jgi:hypothetical protein
MVTRIASLALVLDLNSFRPEAERDECRYRSEQPDQPDHHIKICRDAIGKAGSFPK